MSPKQVSRISRQPARSRCPDLVVACRVAPDLLASFQSRASSIRARWDALLHVEPVSGPLANPDTLAYLIPDSLEQVFNALALPVRAPATLVAAKRPLPACDCGNNPYRAFFIAGEQALTEAFVLLQVELPAHERRESDLAAVIFIARCMAQKEIDTFCGVCAHRGTAPLCRHTVAREVCV